MEENKNKAPQQNGQPNQSQGGGRKRRRRHKGGNGGNGQQNQAPQNVAQGNQNPEKRNNQAGQNPSAQKPQNQGGNKQNANQNPNQGNKQKGDKQKHKNGQNGQNGQKQQGGQNQNANAQPQKQQPQKQQQPQKPQHQSNQKNNKQEKQDKRDENRKDTYVYTLDGNLYINLTNKCSNACDFCVRNERASYYGNYLWLKNGDPTVEKVIAQANGFGDLTRFKEVVFCGFGEPTYKVAEMLALCDFFHDKGLKIRLNTNGQGNLINKRDIVPDLKGKIDFVNISLNASCYEKYQPICRSQYKEAGFESMIEFARLCRRNGVDCRFSIVDCIGEDEVAACKYLAESLKIPLYVRKYLTDS